jgi:hypothetical protein
MARVRLRSRSRRSSRPDVAADGPFDAWTTVGNLDSQARAMVDPVGRVAVAASGWLLDWWIGAEDRWHVPAQEAAVRQQLVGSSPVVETRVRIPTGDAVSRVYGARGPRGEDLVVVEVQNDSKVPLALALAVQPHDGAGRVDRLALASSVLEVNGSPALYLARSPGRVSFSSAADERDAGEIVLAGDAEPVRAASVACGDGGARGVLLFPLAHTATLRVAIVLDDAVRAIEPTELPSAPHVASGWATHSRGGARIEVPDRRLREAIAASTRFLLLGGDGPLVARALDHLGFPDEAATRVQPDCGGALGPTLMERADRWRLHRVGLRDGEGQWLARVVQRWAPHPDADGRRALPAIADLLEDAGEARAAADVRSLAASIAPSPADRPPDLQSMLSSAAPTWTWSSEQTGHDLDANAQLLLAVRAHLVDELEDEVALSPLVPEPWLGRGWEVHDLPTAFGRLSYAIRWHGERPALLWELRPHADVGGVRLTAPALDAGWSSHDRRGEALLAPVPVPERRSQRRGLTIPVTIEPMPPRT